MPLDITPTVSAALEALAPAPCWLVKLSFADGDVYATSAPYVLSWDGHDWQPHDCKVSGFALDQTGLAKASIRLPGHDNPLADRILTGDHIDRPVDIRVGFLDTSARAVLDSPVLLLSGRGSAGTYSKSEAAFQVLPGRSARHVFVPRRWLSPAAGFRWLPKTRQKIRFREATITMMPRGST